MDSETLTPNPRYVQFNGASTEDPTKNKAFLMLVVKDHSDGSVSGAVWCADTDNQVGLSEGWNVRNNVQPGNPGQNDTWTDIVNHSD